MSLAVAPGGDHLVRGTSPFIVCADTIWSAFGDAEPGEFGGYLRKRVSQGFNSILVSVLPIVHDRSSGPRSRSAFLAGSGSAVDPAYLGRAVALTDAAAEAGMVPVLVVAWYDYVAGERGLAGSGEHIFNDGQLSDYLDLITGAFGPYSPMYAVSGDEMFSTADAGPYPDLLAAVRKRAPDSLITMHTTPEAVLPAQLDLSFYAYQSGHYQDRQQLAIELAGRYLALTPRKPVMNLEPCYEGHGYGAGAGRFTSADVRRALWWSVFAGASAGFGYGAHGLWQWHRPGDAFNGTWFSGEPYPWDVALEFPGARDAGLAARLIADHGLYLARPAADLARPTADLVAAPMRDVLAIATSDLSTIAVYTPHATAFTVAAALSSYAVTAMDLARGRWFRPRLRGALSDATRIELPDFIGDALYIFTESGLSGSLAGWHTNSYAQ
jgi:Protein of unknown function (DUF4038)